MKWEASKKRLKIISREISPKMEEKFVIYTVHTWVTWTSMGKGISILDIMMKFTTLLISCNSKLFLLIQLKEKTLTLWLVVIWL